MTYNVFGGMLNLAQLLNAHGKQFAERDCYVLQCHNLAVKDQLKFVTYCCICEN